MKKGLLRQALFCEKMIHITDSIQPELSSSDVRRIYDLITQAYAITEEPMFGPGYERTPLEAIETYVQSNEILIARREDSIVGCLRHYWLDSETYSFGLLSADFSHLGEGIGSALLNRVEEIARNKKATAIRIEIVRPTHDEILIKEQIAAWYQRMGYELVDCRPLARLSASKAEESIVDCSVDYYRKSI